MKLFIACAALTALFFTLGGTAQDNNTTPGVIVTGATTAVVPTGESLVLTLTTRKEECSWSFTNNGEGSVTTDCPNLLCDNRELQIDDKGTYLYAASEWGLDVSRQGDLIEVAWPSDFLKILRTVEQQ